MQYMRYVNVTLFKQKSVHLTIFSNVQVLETKICLRQYKVIYLPTIRKVQERRKITKIRISVEHSKGCQSVLVLFLDEGPGASSASSSEPELEPSPVSSSDDSDSASASASDSSSSSSSSSGTGARELLTT